MRTPLVGKVVLITGATFPPKGDDSRRPRIRKLFEAYVGGSPL